jgi:K+-sensing histidine kinase KdpD
VTLYREERAAALHSLARDLRLQAETERTRSALLSSVSHDLRTPLAVITGAATSLRDGSRTLPRGRARSWRTRSPRKRCA